MNYESSKWKKHRKVHPFTIHEILLAIPFESVRFQFQNAEVNERSKTRDFLDVLIYNDRCDNRIHSPTNAKRKRGAMKRATHGSPIRPNRDRLNTFNLIITEWIEQMRLTVCKKLRSLSPSTAFVIIFVVNIWVEYFFHSISFAYTIWYMMEIKKVINNWYEWLVFYSIWMLISWREF